MKKIITIIMLSFSAVIFAQEKVFHLDDLAKKINSGMSSKEYCTEKAKISVQQAKKSGAPLKVELELKKWVGLACNLDIIAEGKRIDKKQ